MTNLILNITANGNWQVVPNVPHTTSAFSIQAIGSNTVNYKYLGQDTYWTVATGAVRTVKVNLKENELLIQANNAVVVQIELSTNRTTGMMA